jgi:hypothetical protein
MIAQECDWQSIIQHIHTKNAVSTTGGIQAHRSSLVAAEECKSTNLDQGQMHTTMTTTLEVDGMEHVVDAGLTTNSKDEVAV